MLRQVEFHIFLFVLLFILIDWPFLAISANHGLPAVFSYLFVLWSLFILLLFLVSRALGPAVPGEERDDEGGG
jgi:hypothetical membrane protein